MDPNNPWNWNQNWNQGYPYGFPPPMDNTPDMFSTFATPFGMPGPMFSSWNQGANQQFPFQPTQPRQQGYGDGNAPGPRNNNNRRRRGQGQGDSYRPEPRFGGGGAPYNQYRDQRRSYRPGPRLASDEYRDDQDSRPSRSRSQGWHSGSARQDDGPGSTWRPAARSRRPRDGEALSSPMDNLHLNSSSQPSGPNIALAHNPVRHRDTITPPSAASGGVPEPTESYLATASLSPLPLPTPQPILVVIDLNGTLLHRPRPSSPTHFIERPGASAFLRHCVASHTVVVWSSAQAPNVERMCAQLLPPDVLARVVAVWGRDRFGLTTADYRRRTQCYKRLTRLWADPTVAGSHPLAAASGSVWDQSNTVLIDDSAEKARSEPHNAITVPEFGGGRRGAAAAAESAEEEGADDVLPQVSAYLDRVALQGNASAFIRLHPFTVERRQEKSAAAAAALAQDAGRIGEHGEKEDEGDGKEEE